RVAEHVPEPTRIAPQRVVVAHVARPAEQRVAAVGAEGMRRVAGIRPPVERPGPRPRAALRAPLVPPIRLRSLQDPYRQARREASAGDGASAPRHLASSCPA